MKAVTTILYIAAAIAAASATMMQNAIEQGTKGLLPMLVDVMGVDAGLDFASNGVDYLMYTCAVCALIATAMKAAQK